jgi:hypothetical protein
MTRVQVASVLLLLVALTGFLIVLPVLENDDKSASANDILQEAGNIQINQAVSAMRSVSVLRPVVPTTVSEGVRGVEIELQDLSDYAVGDEIALLIPQENRWYQSSVAQVNTTRAGNRVLTGFLDIADNQHRFTFTVGRLQTFGTIQTNRGLYQLEVRDGRGLIISTRKINEKLDFSVPDYVLPERKQLPPEVPSRG